MRFEKLLILCCLALLVSSSAFADLVVNGTNGTYGFQSFSGATPTATGNYAPGGGVTNPNQSGTAYWDHQSYDAATGTAKCNIGYVLGGGANANLTNCNAITGPTPLSGDDPVPSGYWGQNTTLNADASMTFTNGASPNTLPVELEMTITGFGSTDIFGWYDTSAPATLHPLSFGAGNTPESQTSFIIPAGATIGFYLTNPQGYTYRTQSASNSNANDAGVQHFTLFRNTGTGSSVGDFYITAEDLSSQGGNAGLSDFDFNDFVVHIDVAEVPEPGALPVTLAGGLLLGIAAYWRRRQLSSN